MGRNNEWESVRFIRKDRATRDHPVRSVALEESEPSPGPRRADFRFNRRGPCSVTGYRSQILHLP